MENIVYERDYRNRQEMTETVLEAEKDLSTLRGFTSFYNKFVQRLPKVVVPEDKATFERLVPILDGIAKKKGGTLRACVDYTQWDATIDLYVDFFEFSSKEDFALLKDIQENVQTFSITKADDGRVKLSLFINYFRDVELDLKKVPAKELLSMVQDIRNEMRQDGTMVKELPEEAEQIFQDADKFKAFLLAFETTLNRDVDE